MQKRKWKNTDKTKTWNKGPKEIFLKQSENRNIQKNISDDKKDRQESSKENQEQDMNN